LSIAFFEKMARSEKKVLEPIALRKATHEKESSVSDAMPTPPTTGTRAA
jgi:hypothetical protein